MSGTVMMGNNGLLHRPADDISTRNAKSPFSRGVELDDTSFDIGYDDAVQRRSQDGVR